MNRPDECLLICAEGNTFSYVDFKSLSLIDCLVSFQQCHKFGLAIALLVCSMEATRNTAAYLTF